MDDSIINKVADKILSPPKKKLPRSAILRHLRLLPRGKSRVHKKLGAFANTRLRRDQWIAESSRQGKEFKVAWAKAKQEGAAAVTLFKQRYFPMHKHV
jgi:hypothetical protein